MRYTREDGCHAAVAPVAPHSPQERRHICSRVRTVCLRGKLHHQRFFSATERWKYAIARHHRSAAEILLHVPMLAPFHPAPHRATCLAFHRDGIVAAPSSDRGTRDRRVRDCHLRRRYPVPCHLARSAEILKRVGRPLHVRRQGRNNSTAFQTRRRLLRRARRTTHR